MRLLVRPCLFTYTILAHPATIVAQWAPEGSITMTGQSLLVQCDEDNHRDHPDDEEDVLKHPEAPDERRGQWIVFAF